MLDEAGQVVGINTAINPYGQGIGFAVPIDQISEILDELKSEGRVARGWIGVGLQDLDPILQQRLPLVIHTCGIQFAGGRQRRRRGGCVRLLLGPSRERRGILE